MKSLREFWKDRPPEMTRREIESALIVIVSAVLGLLVVVVAVVAQWFGVRL